MAWEERGNGSYYYRKRRIGGRVVSEYVGQGEVASLVAQLDAIERTQQQAHRASAAAEGAQQDADDQQAAAVATVIATLTRGVLVANGFYQHKRQWRRRREHID